MKIRKVKISNFKCYRGMFETTFKDGVNIIVGNNESGKSTILEAINLALTGLLSGRYVRNELSTYLFNRQVEREYIASLKSSKPQTPPEISIEVYFSGEGPEYAEFTGDGNSDKVKASGVTYRIAFNENSYASGYQALLEKKDLNSIPVEYYEASMWSFARKGITARDIPLKAAMIDSASSRLQNGSDLYVSRIVKDLLEEDERASVSQAHRHLREEFMRDDAIKGINDKLNKAAKISRKTVSISVDLSSHTAWESSLMTFVDDVPFHQIGKGEQCIVKTKLALNGRKATKAPVILIEEPENHLSHGRLNELLHDISEESNGKQLIISTHSSFVANKLGLENLAVLRNQNLARVGDLDADKFFRKLAGYDTLRLTLAKRAILVEGDSDELIVQRAYLDRHGRLPIADDIDVISVGTSFLRFLELANKLVIPVAVMTDNDGDPTAVAKKYANYSTKPGIKVCYDTTVDSGGLQISGLPFNYNTLEPKLVKENGWQAMAEVIGLKPTSEDDLHRHMKRNKTDCALAIFESAKKIKYPSYILEAIGDPS
ncbi:ATP-dependent endonuclease [Lysobacter sp. Root667]|nr:ATP-dependent endonuclease [Lysobacter sp. Root667]